MSTYLYIILVYLLVLTGFNFYRSKRVKSQEDFMVAVVYTDLPNGVIIVLACLLSVPFVYIAAGGFPEATQSLDAGYFAVVNEQFGAHPALKAGGYFLSVMLLLMGVQTMYQKFYSA